MNLIKNSLYNTELKSVISAMDLSFLENKTILITGAYGMIGSCIVDSLMLWNAEQKNPCTIIAIGRNVTRAKERFKEYFDSKFFKFYCHDICDCMNDIDVKIDYIIHAASNADPLSIIKNPVDTLLTNILGTDNLLKYGVKHDLKRFMYVSSGEMYGQPDIKVNDFVENYSGYIDYSDVRSCYPVGKRAAEVLCQSYIKQFGIDSVIVRPCHIFGPTMTKKDSRAVSEFFRNFVNNEDIVLKSDGMLERSHCYVIDAVKAIFIVLKNGICGEAYNIADKNYQMTIKDFAIRVAEAGKNKINFAVPNNIEARGYSKVKRAVLDANKLEKLGWKTDWDKDKIKETIDILKLQNME